jgi:hypothetical protein
MGSNETFCKAGDGIDLPMVCDRRVRGGTCWPSPCRGRTVDSAKAGIETSCLEHTPEEIRCNRERH